jgi:hypothetical protein
MQLDRVCRWGLCAAALAAPACWGQDSASAPAALVTPKPVSPPAIAPLTVGERAQFNIRRAVGPESIVFGTLTSGIQTWRGRPEAWDRTWEGFGQRFGMRMTRSILSNSIDFSVGSALGTDPRYRPKGQGSFGSRLKYALGASFYHYDRSGHRVPALSRFAGIAGSNIISNQWAPEGDNTKLDVMRRCGQQVGWHIGWNVLKEFLPDIKHKLGR